jgi:hypothetical protein
MARPTTLSGPLIGPLATRVSIRGAPKDRLCVEVPQQRSPLARTGKVIERAWRLPLPCTNRTRRAGLAMFVDCGGPEVTG